MERKTAALLGALAVVVGSFMDWMTARSGLLSITVNGIEGDGQLTLIAGVVAGVCALGKSKGAYLVGALAAGAAVAIVVYDYQNAAGLERGNVTLTPGAGLVMIILGGAVAAGVLLKMRSETPSPLVDTDQGTGDRADLSGFRRVPAAGDDRLDDVSLSSSDAVTDEVAGDEGDDR